ncbi:MAG: glycosyltransferase family 2 protein [Clostridia bacterium]|nr:glycosyltransferase family 2 protein [Clostridia bacterium]
MNSIYEMPKISIIVPVYKVEPYLRRCVESLLNQTYRNLEIILVDDGSPDNCPQICDDCAQKDSRIQVIHKENGGQSSARNVGLDATTGEYIAFVDSDDFVHEDYIAYMYQLSQKYDCDIVQIEYASGNATCFPKEESDDIQEKVCDKYAALSGFSYKVIACGKLYRRETIGDVRFPVGLVHEDDATYYRFAYQSKRICISNRKLYYYYMSPDSTMRNEKVRMDFVPVYNARVAYFAEKKEAYLQGKSYERYAIVLILSYCRFLKKRATKTQLQILTDKFREIFAESMKAASLRYKPLFLLFWLFPRATAKMIGLVRR